MQRFGATKPLRPLDPEQATDEKDRKTRLSWQKQIAELPDGGAVPNLGDFTLIKKDDYNGQIDLIVGGTPCQDLSIAGKRLGFEGRRSVLALDFVRLCFETGTRWVCWENVPATLSSHNGEDFAKFLSLLCGWEVPVPSKGWGKAGIVTNTPGHFGLAWRVLDAQYTRVEQFSRAVPQRRKRLFVVGYLDSWKYPCKVLFDGEVCGGHLAPKRTKGQTAPCCAERSTDSAKSIRMRSGKPGGGKGALIGDDLSHTLATGNDQTIVAFEKANGFNFDMWSGECDEHSPTLMEKRASDTMVYGKSDKPVWWNGGDKADTLTCTSDRQLMPDKGRLQCVVEPDVDEIQCLDMWQVEVHDKGVSPTLIATDYKGGKAVVGERSCYENHPQDSRIRPVDVAQAITARMGTGGGNLPIIKEAETIGFIKNDAGGELQRYWNEIFPTIRASVTPAIVSREIFALDSVASNAMKSSNPNSGVHLVDIAKTVDTSNPDPGKNQGGIAVVECFNVSFCDANGVRKDRPNGGLYITEAEASKTVTAGGPNAETVVIALDGDKIKPGERSGGSGMGVSESGVTYTQTAGDVHAVAYEEPMGIDQYNGNVTGKASSTLGVNCGMSTGRNGVIEKAEVTPQISTQATVRRLLPVECERLMGFPDNHTRIAWKGKSEEDCPDAPRYKACGNSMAVNCMMWLGERIDAVEKSKASREAFEKMEKTDE
jgi:site-specific DNA-cytosine methylase